MSLEAKMSKETQLEYTKTIMEPTRNGRLSILIRPQRMRLRDSMKNSVSTSIDHST
jgi:hypothetical protein